MASTGITTSIPTRLVTPRHTSAAAAPPVVVRLGSTPDVVRAGIATLLAPHSHRVTLRRPEDDGSPDVEIFDPSYELAPAVGARHDCPRIALLSNPTPHAESRALALGAARVLHLDACARDLVDAVEAVGRPAPQMSGVGVAGPCWPGAHGLSGREADIVHGICRGLSNDEIAHELFLSINSVKTYIRATYRKLGVTRRAQAVLWGIENGYGPAVS